jgi:fatty acid-binding protein DegV
MVDFFRAEQPVEYVAVMHAQAREDADRIAEDLRKEVNGLEITVGQIGSVLGTHTGPRALGVVYIKR